MASNKNVLRELLDAGKPTISSRIVSTWPMITETLGATGYYDYVEYMAEYSPYNDVDFENIARAAELHGMGSVVKTCSSHYAYMAQRAVASGIQGILFTDLRTKEQFADAIKSFMPDCPKYGGKMGYTNRRWIGYRKVGPQMEYADMVARTVVMMMVEKKETLENLDDILTNVKGIDMVQFGPQDYALSNGFNSDEHPEEMKEAQEHMIKTAIKHGVRPRVEIRTTDQAKHFFDLGVIDYSIGNELLILQNFWNASGKYLKDMLKDVKK